MQELLNLMKELSIKHRNICFKVMNEDSFYVGIISNEKTYVCKFALKYYNDFDVDEYDSLKNFNNAEYATIESLSQTDFSNVGYFIINGNKLVKYIGNQKEVIIPNNVDTILYHAFKNNKHIEIVRGNNVKDIQHYAFIDNENLTTIDFPNLVWLGNVLRVPNLKHYTISDHLMGIINEDNDYSNSIINVNGTPYVFDDSIESEFMEKVEVLKENPNEQIQVIKLSDGERRFRSVNDNHRNQTIAAISHAEGAFGNLPDVIKDVFYKTGCIIYIVDQLPDAGLYYVDKNIILVHRTQVNYALYHEIGHMIDKYLDNISSTYDFKRIYYSEAHKLYSGNSMIDLIMSKGCKEHLTSTAEEYFAESVKRYLENDSSFQEECPNTYMFIKDSIEYLEKKNQTTLELK